MIIGAGDVFPPKKHIDFKLVIAADGGYYKAKELGFQPDVVIGDFDSGSMPADTEAFVVKLNREKDDTDMLSAVKLGLRRGYREFAIYGGVGGRLDHTAANFAVLRYLNNFDARGYLADEHSVSTVITDGKITLPKNMSGTVSVFAYGGNAEGVTLKGLKYPLDDYTVTPDFPIGASNEKTAGAPAEINVKHGSLLIFLPR